MTFDQLTYPRGHTFRKERPSLLSREVGNPAIQLPFSTHFEELVPKEGIYGMADRSLPLGRLANVRQLGNITFTHDQLSYPYHLGFRQTRYDHSLLVARVMEHIGVQNGLQQEFIDQSKVIGLIHDIATPAGGDAIKTLDPINLNEETHWSETVGPQGKTFIRSVGLTDAAVSSALLNKKGLGKLLDIADRISYTTTDLAAFLPFQDPQYFDAVTEDEKQLKDLATAYPDFGDIYTDVRTSNNGEDFYFDNSDRLYAFLKIRALLFKNIYLHPSNQARDFIIASLMRPLYSSDERQSGDKLTPSILRQMTDNALFERLAEEWGYDSPLSLYFDFSGWIPRFERCDTQQEARERAATLRRNQEVLVIGVHTIPGLNPSTDFQVSTPTGILPFKTAQPEKAAEIHAIADSVPGTYVFYHKNTHNEPMNEFLPRVFAK